MLLDRLIAGYTRLLRVIAGTTMSIIVVVMVVQVVARYVFNGSLKELVDTAIPQEHQDRMPPVEEIGQSLSPRPAVTATDSGASFVMQSLFVVPSFLKFSRSSLADF